MPEQFTVYARFPAESSVDAEQLVDQIRALESVSDVVAQAEEPTRSGLEVIQDYTLVITAVAGAVAATGVLIDRVRELLAKFGAKSVQVEATEGKSDKSDGGVPRSENPAQ